MSETDWKSNRRRRTGLGVVGASVIGGGRVSSLEFRLQPADVSRLRPRQ